MVTNKVAHFVCLTCRVEERVGRQLAVIGDEVDVRYAGLFYKMIDSLSLGRQNTSSALVYDNLAALVRQSVSSPSVMLLCLHIDTRASPGFRLSLVQAHDSTRVC